MAHFVNDLRAYPTLLTRLSGMFETLVTSSARGRELDRLNALTDEQLQELGLRRQDIVHRVMGDCYAG